MMKNSKIDLDEICTTQEAAKLLGISVSYVQQLVESGAIDAWKTKGGHRRIPIASVHAYRAAQGRAFDSDTARGAPKRASILVVEDNDMQRAIYEKKIASWNLPADLRFCTNGYQALIEIASRTPNILLTDIEMDGIDGFEVINAILDYPALANMNIAILSGVTPAKLAVRGGVPDDVIFFSKPVNYDELHGYLRACCAQVLRKHQP